ncbi:FAD binding domain-containing protein [Clostridium grantii DSM 8605]|uniref:L-aspartate oxidase n=1 Tax=Clostridium grantii DSM 8605 TaxID=1121316 RepID=A0A1M5X276_9CLOT|nr:FAD binding domain-containing protein [Clostridium grantii DSM 8605]
MKINTDVLIAGSGLAGLYTALNLNESLKVTIITKASADNCNTYLAQGGLSTVLNEQDQDVFVEDTLKAGLYKNDINAVKILAKDSKKNIDYYEEIADRRRFLISESLRGKGGILVNNKGQRFVDELLPRDVVSKKYWRNKRKQILNVYI